MAQANLPTLSFGAREEQWVSRVVEYSSQYNNDTWAAHQVIGPPKVYPRYGDLNGAWAQGNRANNEYIVVEFPRAVNPEQIDIYETYHAGAVIKVSVRNGTTNSDWETVFEVAAPHVEGRSRIFSIPCRDKASREINQIRVVVNCTAAGSWCEIDCIKLIGYSSYRDVTGRELVMDFRRMLTDDCFADVTFELDDGERISSYRNILRTRCLYFAQLFDEHPSKTDEPIRITHISSKAFRQILHYIHTDAIESVIDYETCLELMRKADEYYLSPIYNQALDGIKRVISTQNVLKLFIGACPPSNASNDSQEDDMIILTDVINLCVQFVQKNRQEVYRSEQMRSLPGDMLLQLVQLVL